MTAGFDTLKAAERLQEAGFEPSQAKAITNAINSIQSDLATKSDIQRLEDKINNLRWTMIVVAGVIVALIKLIP